MSGARKTNRSPSSAACMVNLVGSSAPRASRLASATPFIISNAMITTPKEIALIP